MGSDRVWPMLGATLGVWGLSGGCQGDRFNRQITGVCGSGIFWCAADLSPRPGGGAAHTSATRSSSKAWMYILFTIFNTNEHTLLVDTFCSDNGLISKFKKSYSKEFRITCNFLHPIYLPCSPFSSPAPHTAPLLPIQLPCSPYSSPAPVQLPIQLLCSPYSASVTEFFGWGLFQRFWQLSFNGEKESFSAWWEPNGAFFRASWGL